MAALLDHEHPEPPSATFWVDSYGRLWRFKKGRWVVGHHPFSFPWAKAERSFADSFPLAQVNPRTLNDRRLRVSQAVRRVLSRRRQSRNHTRLA